MINPNTMPIVSIVAGILILVYPRILNYVVALYFLLMGILALLAQ
jgi:hypothetical protein